MINDGTEAPTEALEEILEAVQALALREIPAPVVNVASPAVPVTVNVPECKPCIPVAYRIEITQRDMAGRIAAATLTPI
jgi:hypothetical protein